MTDEVTVELLRDYLDKTIPSDDPALKLRSGKQMNGGTSRGNYYRDARIATYNNTRANEQEVLDWIERARLLYLSESVRRET